MDAVIVKLEKLFQWFLKVHIDPTVTIRTVSCALLEASLQWQEVGKSLNVPNKKCYSKLEMNVKKIFPNLSTKLFTTGSLTTTSVGNFPLLLRSCLRFLLLELWRNHPERCD